MPAACLLLGLLAGCPRSATSESANDAAPPAMRAPMSVLLLTVDTLRPDYLSMYGYDRPTSPYLDRLLASGFHFERATTTVPRTTPALASLLTGAYPHSTGVRKLLDRLDPGVVTLAQALRRAGYRTLAVVTNQVLEGTRGLGRGFELYDQAGDARGAAETTDAALRHLRDAEADRPLFLWAHYIDPHMPYVCEPEIVRAFDPDYGGRYELAFGQQARGRSGPFPPDLPKTQAVYENPLPPPVNAHIRRLYAADIRSTDDQLQRLVERVREVTGDNLLIVFTADHGESLGEHDYFFAHGEYVYDAASRVPLVFLLPPDHALAGGGRSRKRVSLVDVAPTVLDVLGLPGAPGEQVEGRSLLPLMAGSAAWEPAPVFVESGRSHHFAFVRGRASNDVAGRFRAAVLGDWKLIWAPGHESLEESWQLYDLASDPGETRNLFREDHPEFLRLREPLLEWAARSAPAQPEREASPEERALLNELGYTDGEED